MEANKKKAIDDYFRTIPTIAVQEQQKQEITKIFKLSEKNSFLSLYNYIDSIPQKFYSHKAFLDSTKLLKKLEANHQSKLLNFLRSEERKISLAFKYLNEINELSFHDLPIPVESVECMYFIETHIHSNYLKLVEGVFGVLARIIAYYELISAHKNTDCLSQINSIFEVLQKSEYLYLATCWNKTIRNGIAHGDFTYKDWEVIYRDSRGNTQKLSFYQIIELFDETVDLCNGLALALRIYILSNLKLFDKFKLSIPMQLMLDELKASANTQGWEVIDSLESTIKGNQNQLVIFVRNSALSYQKVFYFTFRTVLLAEKLLTGYDRYFFNLNNKYALTGWAGFNGKLLTKLRKAGENNIAEYYKTLEEGAIFFWPKFKLPRALLTIGSFFSTFYVNYRFHLKNHFSTVLWKPCKPRHVRIHRKGFYSAIVAAGDKIPKNAGIKFPTY